MDFFIYRADVYCGECGRAIRKRIESTELVPANPKDEKSYDSDEYPKGPYNSKKATADSPQHCGNGPKCLDPTIIGGEPYGKFLENPLTIEGKRNLREMHEEPNDVTRFWMKFYGA